MKNVSSLRRYCKPEKREQARAARNNMTSSETRLWYRLRCKRQGFKVRRQVIIRGFIVDFYAPQKRLVIEIDGSSHEMPAARAHDERRTKVIEDLGFRVIRFTNDDIWQRLDQVLEKIKQAAAGVFA